MYKARVDYKSDLSSGQNLTVVIHSVLVVINANNCIGFFQINANNSTRLSIA